MKLELTKEESEAYMSIVRAENMDAMFDLGYVIGRARLSEEQLEMYNNHLTSTKNK